jgi:signal transduction histidine kinase
MTTNNSIKKKLLIYNFFIHCSIILLFSFSLYKALELSSLDKIQSNLKVILLDVVDDIYKYKDELRSRSFDENKEYKFEPLYIRLLNINKIPKIVSSTYFPKEIEDKNYINENLKLDTIYTKDNNDYIISYIKIKINRIPHIVEVATNHSLVNSTLVNLIYVLLFIVPIILILSTLGGYFIIAKSFSPIEILLVKLENVSVTNLSKRLFIKEHKNDEISLIIEKINNLLEKIELSYNKVSQFSSDASHELKTPLTIIRGEIELSLKKERSNKEYRNTLEKSLKQVLLIQTNIEDLLFLSKIEKKEEIIKEIVYLDEVSIESIEGLSELSKIKKIKLKIDIKEPISLTGNKSLLKIAIDNIVKNAINYSNEGSIVLIKNYSTKDSFILSVIDRGIGISEDDKDKIFEEFYRIDKSRNKDTGGSGLGLSICKKIIELHNGKINIESVEKEGTIIYFIFPK